MVAPERVSLSTAAVISVTDPLQEAAKSTSEIACRHISRLRKFLNQVNLRVEAAIFGLAVETIDLTSSDNIALKGWWIRGVTSYAQLLTGR